VPVIDANRSREGTEAGVPVLPKAEGPPYPARFDTLARLV